MPNEAVVHVIDDDEAVRDSLAFLFDSADLPVTTHESAVAFLAHLPERIDGCIVTDVRMPEMSGLDLLNDLRGRGIDSPVVIITGHGDVPLAVEAMKAGAFDFLEKPFDDERLLDVVRRALQAPRRTGAPEASAEQAGVQTRIARLSQRERQVLKRLVEGQLNKTIAWELGISARTVEVYRAKLMAKMEANAFADLVRMALLAGPIDEEQP
jgi:two-component system, LuxR family, response regulator FixJ